MADFVTVLSGFICSSGVTLSKGDRPISLIISSMAGASVSLQCSDLPVTTATSADYYTLAKGDGTGAAPYVVYTGGGPGVTYPIQAPTPNIRILMAAQPSGTRSFTIVPVLQ